MNIFQRTFKLLRNSVTGDKVAVGIEASEATATLDVNGDMRVRLMGNGDAIDSIAVVDGDGNVFQRSLSSMLPTDLFLSNAAYDDNTNIITLTLSDGSTFPVDLSDLVDLGNITKLVDSNGDTSVEVEQTADEDIVWVTVENTSVLKVEAEMVSILKNAELQHGYTAGMVEILTDYTVQATDHLIVAPSNSNTTEIIFPSIASLPNGKVFEIKNEANILIDLLCNASDVFHSEGVNSMTMDAGMGVKYIRLMVDKPNNQFIILEELERHGVIYDGTPAIGGTTITDTSFTGFNTAQVNVYRDGVMESKSDYTLESGVLTTTSGAWEGETVQVRLV